MGFYFGGFYDDEAGSSNNNPLVNHQSLESAKGLIEQQIIFSVKKDRQYLLMLYYKGEISKDARGNHICEYFQAMLSFNTDARLLNELICVTEKTHSFSRDLP